MAGDDIPTLDHLVFITPPITEKWDDTPFDSPSGKFVDWRPFVPQKMRVMWSAMDDGQRGMVARFAQILADEKAEPSDYERGFADGYGKGFEAGHTVNAPFAFSLTGAQPQLALNTYPLKTSACACPLGTVCQSSGCPRHTSGVVRY